MLISENTPDIGTIKRGDKKLKYKYIINRKVRVFVEHELFTYKANIRLLETLEESMLPPITPNLSFAGGNGGNVSMPVENAAIRLATDNRIEYLRKSINAIQRILEGCSGITRELITLVYIDNRFTVEGAALQVHCSKTVAYQLINNFLCIVASEMGLADLEERI